MVQLQRWSILLVIAIALTLGWAGSAAAGPTAAQKCEAAKNKAAGKNFQCRATERAKQVIGAPSNLAKCYASIDKAFSAAERAGKGACPTQNDAGSIAASVDGDSVAVAAALTGAVPEGCGDGVKDGAEECDTADLGGQTCTGLGFPGGILACSPFCRFDVGDCGENLPATGQTTSSTSGSDGDIRAGRALNYVDNGDGTITDRNTGLTWEKKWQDGGLHDVNNTFTWTPGSGSIWEWLGFVNAEGVAGFAGHSDWRIPNIKELQSIVSYGTYGPAVDAVFNSGCVASCTMLACSCTAAYYYWSSTTYAYSPANAWYVGFSGGGVGSKYYKYKSLAVRAVRGGL